MGEAGESQSTAPNEIADEIAPVNCNLTEVLGTAGPSFCSDCESLPPRFGDATKGFAALATDSPSPTDGQPLSTAETRDRGFSSRCGEILVTTRDNVFGDYANYYSAARWESSS